jgi:hypothetical protein
VLLALPLLPAGPALAQKRIPKLPGNDQCPLGYVVGMDEYRGGLLQEEDAVDLLMRWVR